VSRIVSIYALWNADSIVYVGRSCNVKDRLHAHRARGIKFDSHSVLETCGAEVARDLEEKYILLLNPEHNLRKSGHGPLPGVLTERSVLRVEVSTELKAKVVTLAKADNRTVADWLRVQLTQIVKRNSAKLSHVSIVRGLCHGKRKAILGGAK